MVIKYHISPTAIAEALIAKIWESQNDNPGAEVFSENIPAPHALPYTIIAMNLDTVTHIVRLYGADSGNLYHFYEMEATAETLEIFTPIRFKIGDGNPLTPAAESKEYINPLLVNLNEDDYLIYRNNYGILFPDLHYSINAPAGSWQLTGADWFNSEEEFTIIRSPKNVTTVVNDSVVGKWFGGFVDIPANTVYDPSHLRKLLRFTAAVEYLFPIATAVPIGYGFCFNNVKAIEAVVKFANAPLLYEEVPVNQMKLPAHTEACFVYDGAFWNMVYLTNTKGNSNSLARGTWLGQGEQNLGNVPSDAWLYTITHNLNISGDYTVFLSIKNTPATAAQDTAVQVTWRHKPDATKKDSFFVVTDELVGGSLVNNVTVCWIIFKN